MATKQISHTRNGLYISGYASTNDLDSCNELIDSQVWKSPDALKRFIKNPVLLFQHKQDSIVGNVVQIKKTDRGLWVKCFISKQAEKAYGIYSLLMDGSLRSFSIGFRPLDARYDKVRDITIITKVALYELSLVSVPANDNCLVEMLEESDDNS